MQFVRPSLAFNVAEKSNVTSIGSVTSIREATASCKKAPIMVVTLLRPAVMQYFR
jgi:hypothetical protein